MAGKMKLWKGSTASQYSLPAQALREEDGALPVAAAVAVGFHRQLQPGPARGPHLGAQAQQLARGRSRSTRHQSTTSPACQGACGWRRPRSSPAPPVQLVQPAADLPGQGQGVPAVLAADAFDDGPDMGRIHVAVEGPLVDVDLVAGPVGVAGQRDRRRRRRWPRWFPPGRPVPCPRARATARAVGGQAAVGLRNVLVDVVLVGDGVVLQRLHQRHGHGQRDGGGQGHPQAGELGGRDGQRQTTR